jgi:hypothetical protein
MLPARNSWPVLKAIVASPTDGFMPRGQTARHEASPGRASSTRIVHSRGSFWRGMVSGAVRLTVPSRRHVASCRQAISTMETVTPIEHGITD